DQRLAIGVRPRGDVGEDVRGAAVVERLYGHVTIRTPEGERRCGHRRHYRGPAAGEERQLGAVWGTRRRRSRSRTECVVATNFRVLGHHGRSLPSDRSLPTTSLRRNPLRARSRTIADKTQKCSACDEAVILSGARDEGMSV